MATRCPHATAKGDAANGESPSANDLADGGDSTYCCSPGRWAPTLFAEPLESTAISDMSGRAIPTVFSGAPFTQNSAVPARVTPNDFQMKKDESGSISTAIRVSLAIESGAANMVTRRFSPS
jgi:hypothetical protein